MLKGGIVGLGRMGITHFSILNTHPSVKFVSVCDSNKFILKNLSKQIEINTFTDYRQMIDNSNLDFLIIATPTVLHGEVVKYAIQKNLHIFVEKPFVLYPQEGQEIIESLKGKNLVNQVGYVCRFNEIFVKVREHLKEGLIGDLCHFKVEMNAPTVLRAFKGNWRAQKEKGGGCLQDFASHGIDLINYFIGPPDRINGSVLQKVYSSGVDDAVFSVFIYDKGFRGNLLANWSDASSRKPTYLITFFGKNGKIIANQHSYKVFLRSAVAESDFAAGWNAGYVTEIAAPVRFYLRGNEYTKQLDYFIERIVNKTAENQISFADALITDRIIDVIVKNSEDKGIYLWTG